MHRYNVHRRPYPKERNQTCGLDEAQFTSTGMFVYFHKLYKIAE